MKTSGGLCCFKQYSPSGCTHYETQPHPPPCDAAAGLAFGPDGFRPGARSPRSGHFKLLPGKHVSFDQLKQGKKDEVLAAMLSLYDVSKLRGA